MQILMSMFPIIVFFGTIIFLAIKRSKKKLRN